MKTGNATCNLKSLIGYLSRDEKLLLLQVLLFKVLAPKQRYGNIFYNNNSNVAYFFLCRLYTQ